MKNIIKYLILLLIMFITTTDSVKALTVSGGKTGYGRHYYDNYLPSGQRKGSFFSFSIDGRVAYCIEPDVDTTNGLEGYYNSTTPDHPLTADTIKKLQLYAYYGYDYNGHQNINYHMATQKLIWETAANDPNYSDRDFRFVNFYETPALTKVRDVSAEENEILRLVNDALKVPSFNQTTINARIGEPITLTDRNGALSTGFIVNTKTDCGNGKATCSISGNNMTIIPNVTGRIQVGVIKKFENYGNRDTNVFYNNGEYQDLVTAGRYPEISDGVIINVTGGSVAINKKDKETGIAQGSGSLKNAIYGVYTASGNLVTKVTTDDNGYAKTDNILNYGSYYIQEISPSKGYKLDTAKYEFILQSSNTTIDITKNVTEEIIKGKIKIIKYDSETNTCQALGESSLTGAKYTITNSKGVVVDTLTIGSDCSATSKELPYDTYTIKEISASKGYKLDKKTYTISINAENSFEVISREDVIKGKIKVTKYDSETKTCKALGQATLVGATYNVLDINNNIVDTITIGNDCTGISKDLPYGRYKIQEFSKSTGYWLDNNIYSINIIDEVDYDVTSYEDVVKNWISILKQYDYVDGNTTLLNAEENITFEIYYAGGTPSQIGKLYDTITTDKNGYATIEIPYGVWRFHQVNTNAGFEKIYDFYITVDYDSKDPQYYNILNNSISAYIQVFKVDSETGKTIAIADTTFKILNVDTNKFVSQYVAGNVYSEFKTDENGKFMTYLKLESGNYKLVEVSSPHNYLLNGDGLNFTIGDETHYSYTTYGAVVNVYFENKPIKGQIEVIKKGENFIIEDETFKYEFVALDGITFNIYADEDIMSADGNYKYYNKGDLVDVITTDASGYAISKKLPLGKYYIVEIETKDNYILDTYEHHFELKEIDNKTPIVYENYTLTNILKKSDLEYTKTDLTNSDPIPNTKISIYTEDNIKIFEGKTDNNGKIIIKDLPVGKYYIVEDLPAYGFVLNEEKVYFEILENGKVIKANMTNKPIIGSLEFSKVDLSTGDPVPNALIEIYKDDSDELIYSGYTDNEGKIVIDNLRVGKYYILESEAPFGYILNEEKMYFEILEDNVVIKATMPNEKIIGSLELIKTDLVTGEPIPNTKFSIYTENDELIFTGLTDEFGKIKIDELYAGKYYILEEEPVTGFLLNEEKVYFEIKENKEIVKVEMTNKKITSIIHIHKVNDENTPLAGVEIGIYDLNDNEIFIGVTDEFGNIEVELEYGSYYYKELSTIDGYQLNEEKYYFDILEDGKVIDSTIINVPNTGLSDSKILNIVTIVLVLCGIGYIIYDKNKKK